MRLLIQHRSRYEYPEPAALGPHVFRLRPASHARAVIESYALDIEQPCTLKWQQDPQGNFIARASFAAGTRVESLDVCVELAVDVRPVNPFDFFLDDRAKQLPFAYSPELSAELAPYLVRLDDASSPLLQGFLAELPQAGDTVNTVVELNQRVNQRVAYVIREEAGVWTPEETLQQGRGSCRDSALLLVAALRSRGLAARFASGYLVQLTDEGMIPGAPRGVGRDVVDLHAWAEVYLPGAGWIGLDATSGLFCGEGHIPLVCASTPAAAAPIEGTSSVGASGASFSMVVGRLGHEPRPTAPYTEQVWEALGDAAARADQRLTAAGVTLTSGGEPTFNARDHAELPEWNTEALGASKWSYGLALAEELRTRLVPGGAPLRRQGKHYPGESLPRWALEVHGRRDGGVLWRDFVGDARRATSDDAAEVMSRLAAKLDLTGFQLPAREDPWRYLQVEAALPLDVDPLAHDLASSEERRRLARVLDQGLESVVGFALPLLKQGGRWRSERWQFRRGHLFLVPGDSPMGLRLPLRGLPAMRRPPPTSAAPPRDVEPDPRSEEAEAQRVYRRELARAAAEGRDVEHQYLPSDPWAPDWLWDVRTALCVEPRGGQLFVFLPPLFDADEFCELVGIVDQVRHETGLAISLEGYPPPPSEKLHKIGVTPDPGVLEVNVPPRADSASYGAMIEQVFDAALHAGLHSEKYLVDGRLSGSGGGHHLALGGPSLSESVFVRRPDVLASLLGFVQHHPSLSYLFTGLFVGPTSQAPRPDEGRPDQLYELEIALEHARACRNDHGGDPPWMSDLLFRHFLTDLTGNTHRAELSIDKLHDVGSPFGRQGLVELRAFEMPPHPRLAIAQMWLMRSLVAAFAEQPYTGRLARHGLALHDRFLLPFWMWRDFEDVLGFLDARGLALPEAAYRPFLELRCPVVGRANAGDVVLELRNAIEPWNVLGEEPAGGGTSRYVDSSVERVELRVDGLQPERHVVLVNGHVLPLRATGRSGEYVAGVRFRAWAPPHALHAHLGIHHPLRFDLVDTWGERGLAGFAYHVWHPEGRAYDRVPLTRFEASARRAARFTLQGPRFWPVKPSPATAHPEAPYCLDLRRLPIDRPMPEPSFEARS
jgi:uncharacterized protein (DUF2126 family)